MEPDSASPNSLPQPEATAFYAILRELQFDLEQLQQLSDHSLEFEVELLQLYLDNLQAQLIQLQQAVSAELWPQVEQITHHIRGASASVGAAKLSQLAEALEQQAKQQLTEQPTEQPTEQSGNIQDLLRELLYEFEWVHHRIAQALLNQASPG